MEEIFKKIARENNTTEKQVEEDILYALNIAIEKSKEDKNARAFWKKALKNKKEPDPKEIVKTIAESIIEEKTSHSQSI